MKSCNSFTAVSWVAAIVGVLAASGCEPGAPALDKNAPVPQPQRPADTKAMPPGYGIVVPPGKPAPAGIIKKK